MTLYDLSTIQVNSRCIDCVEDDILYRIEQRSYTHGIRSTQRDTCTSYLSTTATTTSSLFVVCRHRWHRCHHDQFQVTQIHTHLHGRRAGQDIQAMVLEILLHLTAHHFVNLSGMFCLNEEVRELIDLEQPVSKSSILPPESIVPKYLAVFLCPCLNHLVLWMRCITEIMVRKCHPLFMEFFM